MKYSVLTILLFSLFNCSANLLAQNVVAQRIPANERAIPKIVLSTFKQQYPNTEASTWYVTHLTYWQNDYSSDWYSAWYGQRTVVVYTYQKPTYFEVEFSENPEELSRAIYNLYGYWYETRTRIRGLTMGIYDFLNNSKYKGWKVSLTKEKLASPMWPVEIYRFQVSKGLKSEILRMDAEGNLIQIKILNE